MEHRKAFIHRIIAIIYHLAEQNQTLRGTSNVPFVELMGQFDIVLSEHLRRKKQRE